MIIHHFKSSRVMIAGLAAILAVATLLIANYFSLRTIDPRVTMEFGEGAGVKQTSTRPTGIPTMIDGEVARTVERLSEATALALSASLYAANEEIKRRAPQSARDLLSRIATQNHLPP